MKYWRYSAPSPDGNPITGTMEGETIEQIKRRLASMGLAHATIAEYDPTKPSPPVKPVVKLEAKIAATVNPPQSMVQQNDSLNMPKDAAQALGVRQLEDFREVQGAASRMMAPVFDTTLDYSDMDDITSQQGRPYKPRRRQRFLYGEPEKLETTIESIMTKSCGRIMHMQLLNDSKGKTKLAVVVEFDDIKEAKNAEASKDMVADGGSCADRPDGNGMQRRASESQPGGEQPDGSLCNTDGRREDDGRPRQEIHSGDEQGGLRTGQKHPGGQEVKGDS